MRARHLESAREALSSRLRGLARLAGFLTRSPIGLAAPRSRVRRQAQPAVA
jgi:hypothetical protein